MFDDSLKAGTAVAFDLGAVHNEMLIRGSAAIGLKDDEPVTGTDIVGIEVATVNVYSLWGGGS